MTPLYTPAFVADLTRNVSCGVNNDSELSYILIIWIEMYRGYSSLLNHDHDGIFL